jgi:H(+)-transporting ATP synthase subunit D
MSFNQVKPTVPALRALQSRKKFFENGSTLLEIKREQLLTKFREYLEQYREKKDALRREFFAAFALLREVYGLMGKQRVDTIALLQKIHFSTHVEINHVNIMGIEGPLVKPLLVEQSLPAYAFIDTPIQLDLLITKMKEVFHLIIELAAVDSILYHLAGSYEKIRRRLQVLEDSFIPKLERDINQIQDVLEDIEQEEKIKLKKIKELLENIPVFGETTESGGA